MGLARCRAQGIDVGWNGSGLRWWSRVRLWCELEVGDTSDSGAHRSVTREKRPSCERDGGERRSAAWTD